jgi:UDP-glucose 4-epimerase
VTFDNLSPGHRRAVNWGPLVAGGLLDPTALGAVQNVVRRPGVSPSLMADSLVAANTLNWRPGRSITDSDSHARAWLGKQQ